MISGGEFYEQKKNCGNFALALLCVSLTGCFKSETRLFQEGKYVADITEPFFINDEVEFTKKIEDMYVELHEIDSKTYEASQHKNVVKNRVNKKFLQSAFTLSLREKIISRVSSLPNSAEKLKLLMYIILICYTWMTVKIISYTRDWILNLTARRQKRVSWQMKFRLQ